MTTRAPAVAGSFYPGNAVDLRRQVEAALPPGPARDAWAVVVPHAGYVYSGAVAGAVYARVNVPKDVVLLCFNHRGRGADVAVWPEGAWRTPMGDVPVAEDLARAILERCPGATADESGHLGEHSGEVQLPFLLARRPDVRVAPVALSTDDFDALRAFGLALAGLRGEFLVVASTDLNHYEDQATTLRKDAEVIRALEALDAAALREAVRRGVSMCGYAPAAAACAYARAKGAARAVTVKHATSGDVSGDLDRVVGYVGMIVPCGN
jgi:AmmeMemoRadiSam system protein B